MTRLSTIALALIFGTPLLAPAASAQAPIAPPGFTVQLVADSLPALAGITIAPPGFGAFGGDVFYVCAESSSVVRVSPSGSWSVLTRAVSSMPLNLAFGPGGAFGTDLFVSANQNLSDLQRGAVWRVTPSGTTSFFGTQTPVGPPSFLFGGGDIAFSSAGAFGTFLYTGASGGSAGDCISRIGASGSPTELMHALPASGGGLSNGFPGGLEFGSGLAGFTPDLYFAYWRTPGLPGFGDGIYRMTSGGGVTQLAPVVHPDGIRFGPGGAFGRQLFVAQTDSAGGPGRILTVDSAGHLTTFVRFTNGGAAGLAFADSSALYFGDSNPPLGRLYRLLPTSSVGVPGEAPDASLRMSAAPNPFKQIVSLEWSSARETSADLSIWSVDGRRVRQVIVGTWPAGNHRATWDGRDAEGRRAPPGIYFAQLVVNHGVKVCRLALVR